MVKSNPLRPAILKLFRAGIPRHDIVLRLAIPKRTVYDAIARYLELGSEEDRKGRGRPATVSTPRNRERIRKRIGRNRKQSMRAMAKNLHISNTSVRRLIKSQLTLRPYKYLKLHGLNDRQIKLRRDRCRLLLMRCARAEHFSTVFSDEKIFTIEGKMNSQNDRILAHDPEEAYKSGGFIGQTSHPLYVMVWGGVCATGKTPLVFVTPGVKVNKEFYVKHILQDALLPWARSHFGQSHWTYQQDSAPSHKAKKTQDWLKAHVPDYIPTSEWPPNSPDLNPLDFSVWGVLQAKVSTTKYKNRDTLKAALLKAWAELDTNYLRELATAYERRLKACVKAGGGHIEIR